MAGQSVAQRLAGLPAPVRRAWLATLDAELLAEVARREWWYVARPEQLQPDGVDWYIWLILAGRGWGKTRTGSEWLIDRISESPYDVDRHPTEWGAFAETLRDGRDIICEGPSGLLNVLRRRGIRYTYVRWPNPRITLAGGQKIHVQGADDADVGRGLNLAGAWLDEVCKWRYPTGSWMEGIGPSLRVKTPGRAKPRVVVTTTPKPIRLLVDWTTRTDGSVLLTRGSTFDNAANLSASALEELVRQYGGTRIGRQELHAELLTDVEGALWQQGWIDDTRVDAVPELVHVVVAIDPSGSDAASADEMGLVAVGRGVDGHDYLLADRSGQVVGMKAARRAWQLFVDTDADEIVYEDNQGKDWIRDVLADQWRRMQRAGTVGNGEAPVRGITAVRGKRLRAEPIAARYEQQRVHHVGVFAALEEQLRTWEPISGESPDRLDALVHGLARLRSLEARRAEVASPVHARVPDRLPGTVPGGLAGLRRGSFVAQPHRPV